jgi:hypothetical protein
MISADQFKVQSKKVKCAQDRADFESTNESTNCRSLHKWDKKKTIVIVINGNQKVDKMNKMWRNSSLFGQRGNHDSL